MTPADWSRRAKARRALDLQLILKSFRLEGEDIVRLRTGQVVSASPPHYTASIPKGGSMAVWRIKFALAHKELPATVSFRNGDRMDWRLENLKAG